MYRKHSLLIAVLAGTLFLGAFVPLLAQDNRTLVSIAVPEWIGEMLDEDVFSDFETAHPDLKVHVVNTGDSAFYPPAAYGIEEHLDGAGTYAASADVLYVTNYNLSVETTRAGYILDLAPLTSGDASLNTDDFIPAVWQSFQWDRGVWALPVSADLQLLIYDPAAFDEAGLPYPDASWTLDDLANAARTLTQRNSKDEVTRPGLLAWNITPFLVSLAGHGVYDDSQVPSVPNYSDPALVTLLDTWMALEEEGVNGGFDFNGEINPDEIPIRTEGTWRLAIYPGAPEQEPMGGALLPGGRAGMDVHAFAISSGTRHPEAAYELAKYLTSNPVAVQAFFGVTPARRSLVGVEPEEGNDFMVQPDYSPENRALIDEALANAITVSELRFSEYLSQALNKMREDDLDAATALQQAEADALANLQLTEERRSGTTVLVATPVPTPVLTAGEVAIHFNMSAFISPLPNREQWDQLIEEFVANDPQVGQIVLDTGFRGGDFNEFTQEFDCFFQPYNLIGAGMDLSTLLNLDPFMDADPNFDRSDVVGNALEQMQRDAMTWGLPIIVQPQVLWYNLEMFDEAGVPLPEDGWTVDEFNNALRTLKVEPDTPAPFVPQDFGGNYLLILIASYGGLPLDYRNSPPSIQFTDPAAVDATRQVLDLAKQGYIRYYELTDFSGGMMGGFGENAIYTETLNMMSFRFQMSEGGAEEYPYQVTTYPRGSQFSAIAYDVGGAYISANSANPEACYRWISTMAQHPDLFGAMPARRSVMSDPALAAAQGEDVVAIYQQLDALMQDPNTISFASSFGGGSPEQYFVIQYWLNRAFDRYVLEDADLEAELAAAETNALAFQQCAAGIPPANPSATPEEAEARWRQFGDCAIQIDASMSTLFPELE